MAATSGRMGLHAFAALPRRRPDPIAGILAAAAAGMAAASAAAGMALVARRISGSFAVAPPAAGGWLVAAAGIGLVAAVDAAGGPSWQRWLSRGGLAAAALAVAPFGVPASPAAWAPLAMAGVALLLPRAGRVEPGRRPQRSLTWPRPVSGRPAAATDPAPRADAAAERLPHLASEPAAEACPPEPVPIGFRQRTERYETGTGGDCLRGRAILAVPTGGRTGFAHIGFCPSFAALPTVEVSTDYDGVEAELLVAETLPWGLRLECRLAEPAEEPLEIPVDFEARLPPA
ncbi:MAG: hypothetical protein RLZZ440_138 [Planctomycetota bacterium]